MRSPASPSSARSSAPRPASPAGSSQALAFLAIVFAMINVVGGYMVTDRMLASFKKKEK
jgi:NAD/NADP transhydrogenase alpha subunit